MLETEDIPLNLDPDYTGIEMVSVRLSDMKHLQAVLRDRLKGIRRLQADHIKELKRTETYFYQRGYEQGATVEKALRRELETLHRSIDYDKRTFENRVSHELLPYRRTIEALENTIINLKAKLYDKATDEGEKPENASQ